MDDRLYTFQSKTSSTRATIYLLHGLGEYVGRYTELIDSWTVRGYTVHAINWLGHGRSTGKCGHLGSRDVILSDIDRLLAIPASTPRFLVHLAYHCGSLGIAWAG